MNNSAITSFLDFHVGKAFTKRTWVGRVSANLQTEFFGVNFGSAIIKVSEQDQTISILKKSYHGQLVFRGIRYGVCGCYKINKPLASSYDCAPKLARSAIIQLIKQSKPTHYQQH